MREQGCLRSRHEAVPHSEGVAQHTDPLSCVGHRRRAILVGSLQPIWTARNLGRPDPRTPIMRRPLRPPRSDGIYEGDSTHGDSAAIDQPRRLTGKRCQTSLRGEPQISWWASCGVRSSGTGVYELSVGSKPSLHCGMGGRRSSPGFTASHGSTLSASGQLGLATDD